VLWGFVFTLISNIFSNATTSTSAKLYPTAMRATGAGAAYSISRIVTAALPYILIPALDDVGSGLVFGIVAAALAILIADVMTLGPRATGLTLEALAPRKPRPPRCRTPTRPPRHHHLEERGNMSVFGERFRRSRASSPHLGRVTGLAGDHRHSQHVRGRRSAGSASVHMTTSWTR